MTPSRTVIDLSNLHYKIGIDVPPNSIYDVKKISLVITNSTNRDFLLIKKIGYTILERFRFSDMSTWFDNMYEAELARTGRQYPVSRTTLYPVFSSSSH